MISKQTIKFISSLRQNKYRLKYHCFIAEGEHVVSELINSDFKIHSIFSTNEWNQKKGVKQGIDPARFFFLIF